MGTYTLPVNSWNPAVSGSIIESSSSNATMNDLASAMTQSVSKDGQTTMTGNLPMGNNKITGLANGTTSTDALAYGQGAKLSGDNTFTGDQTINGSVSLSGNLSVTGAVIFTSGTISIDNLTVTSVASIASLTVTGTTNANILAVASVTSLNTLTVASTAGVNVLNVASVASVKTINATTYLQNGSAFANTVVQYVKLQTASVSTGSTAIPFDNTKPQQSTEGTLFLSQAVTPTNASNLLKISPSIIFQNNTAEVTTVALFQDSTADALAAWPITGLAATTNIFTFTADFWMTAGTASATTFKIHIGGSGGGTITLNGNAGTGVYNGVALSSLSIQEYKV